MKEGKLSPPIELTSPQNPLLKRFRRALLQGELTEEGYCAVEGVRLVEEALRSRAEVVAVLAAHSAKNRLARLEAPSDGRSRIFLLPDKLFRSLCQTKTPQGIAALVRLPEARPEDCLKQEQALAVVLAGIQDPGNLGTILRAVDSFGGAACLLTKNTVSPFNAKAVRASAGSLFRVPVFPQLAPEKLFALCRECSLRTVALSPRAASLLSEVDLQEPAALLVGREGSGLPEEMEEQADVRARIPAAAAVDSLNAAMAATLALYEATRQRGFRP